jgi:hypothetical protein
MLVFALTKLAFRQHDRNDPAQTPHRHDLGVWRVGEGETALEALCVAFSHLAAIIHFILFLLGPDFWHAHAFAFTLDATAPARFAEAKQELQLMLEASDKHPVLVLANKLDLAGAADLATIEEALGVAALPRSGRKIAVKVGSG